MCWNVPFKSKIRQQYEDWMLHNEKEVTKGGNPKAAPMAVYLQWIIDAWERLSKELIADSFKACGVIMQQMEAKTTSFIASRKMGQCQAIELSCSKR